MMYFVDRSVVILKPTQLFLNWLNGIITQTSEVDQLTLDQIRTNCRVFLTPQKDTPEEIIAYIDERYEELFSAELASWFESSELWPEDLSLKAFWQFFEVEILDEVIDLEEKNLINDPLFNHD